MRIYVAGPLSGTADKVNAATVTDYIQNCHRMMSIAVKLRSKGHYPYTPCLDVLLGFLDGGWEYDDYADMNLDFMEVCDAMFFIGHSPGADKELTRAKELGKTVYYSIEEVPNEKA